LCLLIAQESFDAQIICLGDRALLQERARQRGLAVQLRDYEPGTTRPHQPGELQVLHQASATTVIAGQLDRSNAAYVLSLLDIAIDGALRGEFAAVVTAPVHKSIINESGVPFSGHTEYFADRTYSPLPVMLLVCDGLKVALATTHMPLKAVSSALTAAHLQQVLKIIHSDLIRLWDIRQPRIAVCGLNPHAGENGHLGDEEIHIITPAIAALRAAGFDISGPLPADTVFVPAIAARYDAILAMYHDQGLPVIKRQAFDSAVNVTLGLPIIRTSVDHGTALELAGNGAVSCGSLSAALRLAVQLGRRN
jgi:4-hydroxythreonine-4-phosphate dehydrogenase